MDWRDPSPAASLGLLLLLSILLPHHLTQSAAAGVLPTLPTPSTRAATAKLAPSCPHFHTPRSSRPPSPLAPRSILPVVSQVASTLHFNPALEYIADRVVAYMTRDGRRTFNGGWGVGGGGGGWLSYGSHACPVWSVIEHQCN